MRFIFTLIVTLFLFGCTDYDFESPKKTNSYNLSEQFYTDINEALLNYAKGKNIVTEVMSEKRIKYMSGNSPGIHILFLNKDKLKFIITTLGEKKSTVKVEFYESGFNKEEELLAAYNDINNILNNF